MQGYWPGAPDPAVEVVSPSDLYTEVSEKVTEWLQAGSSMVMVVNPPHPAGARSPLLHHSQGARRG